MIFEEVSESASLGRVTWNPSRFQGVFGGLSGRFKGFSGVSEAFWGFEECQVRYRWSKGVSGGFRSHFRKIQKTFSGHLTAHNCMRFCKHKCHLNSQIMGVDSMTYPQGNFK